MGRHPSTGPERPDDGFARHRDDGDGRAAGPHPASDEVRVGPPPPDSETVYPVLDLALRIGEIQPSSGAGGADVTATVPCVIHAPAGYARPRARPVAAVAALAAGVVLGRFVAQPARTGLSRLERRLAPVPGRPVRRTGTPPIRTPGKDHGV